MLFTGLKGKKKKGGGLLPSGISLKTSSQRPGFSIAAKARGYVGREAPYELIEIFPVISVRHFKIDLE